MARPPRDPHTYIPQGITEAPEQDLGGDGVATMETTGDAKMEHADIVPAQSLDRFAKEKLEMLQFMAEPVKVHIHDVSETNADPNFSIGVNGRNYYFFRGEEKTVPRFVVEGLARAKPVGYRNEPFKMQDGSDSVRWPKRAGLRYSFATIGDSPKGNAWLKSVLAQP